jgi:hypothetical protein
MTLPITTLLYSDFMLGIPPTLYASCQIWFQLQARGLAQRFGVKQGQQYSQIMLDNYPADACAGKGGITFNGKKPLSADVEGFETVEDAVVRSRCPSRAF